MVTTEIRFGRYQDVLADVTCDTVIVDPPYGAKVHEAVNDENAEANGYTTPIAYAHWTPRDVEQFVDSWAPRTRCWIVAMTSHDLVPHWISSYEVNGLYAFAPVNAVISGMGVRQLGDGPASWADANGSPAALAEQKATGDKRDHEARWREFRADHPEAWPAILDYLRSERERGERRLSMARCWEALRGRFGKGFV